MKKFALATLFVFLFGLNVSSVAGAAEKPASAPAASSSEPSPFSGPSVHLAVGIRMRKAPDLDTYYSTVGGLKISAFSAGFGNGMVLSFLAPGLHYAGFGIFAPSLTPVIIGHQIGIGFGVDFFTVRDDRLGGPVGMSLNVDVIRVANFVMTR